MHRTGTILSPIYITITAISSPPPEGATAQYAAGEIHIGSKPKPIPNQGKIVQSNLTQRAAKIVQSNLTQRGGKIV
jgi:hypothetical protein